jgi:hypothetical protein
MRRSGNMGRPDAYLLPDGQAYDGGVLCPRRGSP